MKMRVTGTVLILGMLCYLAGCANRMKVTVEMIEPAEDLQSERVVEGTYAAAVQQSISALYDYVHLLNAVKQVLLEQKDCGKRIQDETGTTYADETQAAEALINDGTSLVALMKEEFRLKAYVDVRQYTANVAQWIGERIEMWRRYASDLEENDPIRRALEGTCLKDFDILWGTALSAAQEAREPGFGGYSIVGVHRICPGDPNYKSVLQGTPIHEPITLVDSQVLGDSIILFVQESPTQIRVHSVDMDAQQLLRNVSYISNKALQAWVKYMGLPAPTMPNLTATASETPTPRPTARASDTSAPTATSTATSPPPSPTPTSTPQAETPPNDSRPGG